MRTQLLLVWLVLVGASPVLAQPLVPSHIDSRFRIGLESTVFQYEAPTLAIGDTLRQDREVMYIGVQQQAALGPVFSYGVSEHALLGVRLTVAQQSGTLFADSRQLRILVLPTVEYVFSEGELVRPFVGGTLGFSIDSEKSMGTRLQSGRVLLAVQAGVHAFLSDHVSVEPALLLGYAAGAGRCDLGFGDEALSVHGPVLLLSVGLSYWR